MSEETKSEKKVEIKTTQMNIETFISMKGGISGLNRASLIRKFGDEQKKGEEWMTLLVKLTILKEKDSDFLKRKI